MGKMRFTLDGSEESVKNAVRQFTADKALMKINKESVKILLNSDSLNISPAARLYSFTDKSKGQRKKYKVIITGWLLHDLAYRIILHSNDYRGRDIKNDEELAALINVTSAYTQKWESNFLDNNDISNNDFLFYIWGFSGEQFKYQNLSKCLDIAGRELYIIFECGNRINTCIDVADIVYNKTGMNWKEVLSHLFLAWYKSTISPYLLDINDEIVWDTSLSYYNYKRILQNYTLDYNLIRNDSENLGRQQLYAKPFIQTQHSEIISVNAYLNLFLYEHCILWIVRDFYKTKNNRLFTSEFGKYFEEYVKELLATYLHQEQFYRIPENNENKRADWKVEIGEYKLLIEQKSAFLSLFVKQQETDINKLKEYCKRNIIEAIKQLEKTELDFGGKYIKIVLLYEEYLSAEIIDNIFCQPECPVINDKNYWLMTISEFERLLVCYSKDSDKFTELVKEKIHLESIQSHEGRSIDILLNKYGMDVNEYIKLDKIKKYRDLARTILEDHMRKK